MKRLFKKKEELPPPEPTFEERVTAYYADVRRLSEKYKDLKHITICGVITEGEFAAFISQEGVSDLEALGLIPFASECIKKSLHY